jgi:serine acetyltransferase
VEFKGKCYIYANVVIGAYSINYSGMPKIGKNVIIYSNVVIAGDITIPDNTSIKAGSVLIGNKGDKHVRRKEGYNSFTFC